MEVSFLDLREKEIVNVYTGSKLGRISDVVFNSSNGRVLGVLVPGLRYESNGAARWINLKFTTFQPSEVAKVALVIFYAAYLSNNREK